MTLSNLFIAGAVSVFALSLFFAFTSGFRNAPLIAATVVSTRAISPNRAFLLCATGEFLGAVFLGSAVVQTISRDMFGDLLHSGTPPQILLMLISTIGSAIVWGAVTYLKAIPTSNSHALIAGFTGASWAAWGSPHLFNFKLVSVFAVLIATPICVLILAAAATSFARWAGAWMTPKVVPAMDNLHVVSACLAAGADGSNNGQLTLSVAVLAWSLVEEALKGSSQGFFIPMWMKVTVAGLISLGVLMGGRRIIKKLGMSFYRIEIMQGLGAELTAALVLLGCISHGFPASTSHVVTGSVLGAGVAKNPKDIRWSLATDIVLSWFITLPAVGLLSALFYKVASYVGGI